MGHIYLSMTKFTFLMAHALSQIFIVSSLKEFASTSEIAIDCIYYYCKNVRAPITKASTPVLSVGWITGAKYALWLIGS